MIGMMVPSVFAGTIDDVETVSHSIGSATLDEFTSSNDGFSCDVVVTGFINIKNPINNTGEIIVIGPGGSSASLFSGKKVSFLPGHDGSFVAIDQMVLCTDSGVYKVVVSYGGVSIGTLQFFIHDIEQFHKNEKAAEQRAAEQRAAEQKAAEQRAAEQRAAEQRAAEQRAAEARAQAAIRAAEAKAAQDLTNLLIIGGIAIIIISVAIVLAKRKNKKSTSNVSQSSKPSGTYRPPPPTTSTNTESSTMFFYECPKCHSGDIQNNPDGSVNCPSCGYRG